MENLEIVQYPHPILAKVAQKVDVFGEPLAKLIRQMKAILIEAGGVGLAAVQVNQDQRLCLIWPPEYHREEKGGQQHYRQARAQEIMVLVNPEIVQTSIETDVQSEGCLSIPGVLVDKIRYQSITVQAYNEKGHPIHFDAQGFLARIIQHECDHLKGRLIIDDLSPQEKQQVLDYLSNSEQEDQELRFTLK